VVDKLEYDGGRVGADLEEGALVHACALVVASGPLLNGEKKEKLKGVGRGGGTESCYLKKDTILDDCYNI
jgi:hypothetical protein